MFVDDIFILGSGDVNEWRYLKVLVDLFCNASGLDINFSKLVFVYSNVVEIAIQVVARVWEVAFSPLEEGLKYLGYHLKATYYRVLYWHWLLQKFQKRLQF